MNNPAPPIRWPALALAAAAASMPAAAATDVYVQAPNGALAAPSAVYDVPGDPGYTWSRDLDEQLWAYFSPGADLSFNRIGWVGSASDGGFAIDFFAASCFSCGLSFVRTDGRFPNSLLPDAGPWTAAQVHQTALGNGLYAYHVDLGAAVSLSRSTSYAVSVVNNYSTMPFQWAASDTGVGRYARYIVGMAMVQGIPGNLAFTLSNTLANVPEAPAAALHAAGLVLVAMRLSSLRRHRAGSGRPAGLR